MTELPIPFTGPEVLAVLDGRKTQTRRPIKPQPVSGEGGRMVDLMYGRWGLLDGCLSGEWRCPFGQPGDRLWVRESFAYITDPFMVSTGVRYRSDGREHFETPSRGELIPDGAMVYNHCSADYPGNVKWRPSNHMPRWASRITLEVTSVHVQRLQEISEGDARAEGKETDEFLEYDDWQRSVAVEGCGQVTYRTLRSDFRDSWDSIHYSRGLREFGWASNPWVWVVEFKRVEP